MRSFFLFSGIKQPRDDRMISQLKKSDSIHLSIMSRMVLSFFVELTVLIYEFLKLFLANIKSVNVFENIFC